MLGIFFFFKGFYRERLPRCIGVHKFHIGIGRIDSHQLIFDPFASFNCEAQNLFDFIIRCLSVWKENLHHSREGLVDPVPVSCGDVA